MSSLLETVYRDTRYRAWVDFDGDGRVVLERVRRWQPAYRAKVFGRMRTVDLGDRWVRVPKPGLRLQLALEKAFRQQLRQGDASGGNAKISSCVGA